MFFSKATVAIVATYISLSTSVAVNQTTCNGKSYTYEELAGYGFVASDARDKFGDTIGGIGSSIAIDQASWRLDDKGYQGILWALPDRGWNTNGTLNVQSRIHKFNMQFTEASNATVQNPSKPNLQLQYVDTVLLTGPDGMPTTGLDADATGYLSYPGFPDLPAATYPGDGYGGAESGGKRISLDTEGLVLGGDGSFWISDEYGPYVYHFNKTGTMVKAIRAPEAFIPLRNGAESFNSNTPPYYNQLTTAKPTDPTAGRANNQGFEGLTVSRDGKTLTVLTQSALMQEGGASSSTRRLARLLQYDISKATPVYLSEYVVPLPLYQNAKGNTRIASQSEIQFISSTQFLVLSRDSSAGNGQDDPLSRYRHVDVFDISSATNLKGPSFDAVNASIASSSGNLRTGIVAATYCPFLDFNVNSQLKRFGVHNGAPSDAGLLNEKWESLAYVPVNGETGEYFLFSFSDNDFITQNGYLNFGKFKYADQSKYNLNNQALVFKVLLPVV